MLAFPFAPRNLLFLESPSSRTYAPSRDFVPHLSFLSAVKLLFQEPMKRRRGGSVCLREKRDHGEAKEAEAGACEQGGGGGVESDEAEVASRVS
jgi:hypothetical protein